MFGVYLGLSVTLNFRIKNILVFTKLLHPEIGKISFVLVKIEIKLLLFPCRAVGPIVKRLDIS